MTVSRDEEILLGLDAALVDELTGQLDLESGLRDIKIPFFRHEALLDDIDGNVALEAGLTDILPRARETAPELRRRNARPVNEPVAGKGPSSGGKTDALILIESALSDLSDIHQWATGPRTAAFVVDESMLDGATVQLRQLSKGISDGSLSLEGALSRVREAARNINDFMAEGFPLAVGLAVRRALERLQQLEVLLPRLFDSSGNMTRTLQ